jgi:hypothetical protein
MKTYQIKHKIKGERVWSEDCYKYLVVQAKTKKEAREKAFEQINEYRRTIVSIEEVQ